MKLLININNMEITKIEIANFRSIKEESVAILIMFIGTYLLNF